MSMHAALNALTDLIDTARCLGDEAARVVFVDKDRERRLVASRVIIGLALMTHDLDATRTRLVQDGAGYLDAAWAFVDAGRRMLAEYSMLAARAGIAR